ncbi:IS66-like element accessory protein TnpA [Palleronia abyssalis]|uniref:Transposase n=1 Tax=Palleronia abyssalis TaxID=1501240 RepID=A0A2R8C0N0_9RHOB|nr:transposase [Palleronia abyssalis]SPJ25953.1 hypothetical protein PAA8504_03809 [Palleronia abyssalis]
MADLTFRPEIEVLSAADGVRRRQRSEADKLRIVEESFLGHRQASATARRHGISRSLMTTWRRQYRNGELGVCRPPSFTPLALAVEAQDRTPETGTLPAAEGKAEIMLANGRRLVVPLHIDPAVLARLLPAVDGQ